MKKSLLLKKVLILFSVLFALCQFAFGQALLIENFDYPSGALLTANGWVASSGAGTQPIDVIVPGLIFPGYPSSGIGGAAQVDNNGEDDYKSFTTQTSGSVYAAFLVKVNVIVDGYFLNLGPNFTGRLFLKTSGSNFFFGLSKSTETATYTTTEYTVGTTYLVVLKYEIVDGTVNDKLSLYVLDSTIPSTEPVTPAIPAITGTAADVNPNQIALRQFNASQRILVDGIRVATNWTDAISDISAPIPNFVPTNSATDVVITATPTITFDEAVVKTDGSELTNSDLASLVTFKKTNASGENVGFSATIDATKKVITITPSSSLDNSQVYYLGVGAVKDASGNQSTASNVTFTTIAAATLSVTLTYPIGGETMYAGQAATITWNSANITNALIEVWVLEGSTRTWGWIPFVPATPAAPGKVDITVPATALYGTEYKIRISDLDNPAVQSIGGNFTIIAVATSIAGLREECVVNDIVRLNSEAIVTFLRPANRNQKYIQDSNAGLIIDDAGAVLTTPVVTGDKISGLEGKLGLYNGVLQIVPTKPTVSVVSTGNSVTIPSMTIPEFNTNYAMYESMLVKLTNINFTGADGIVTFAASTTYNIHEGTNNLSFRTFYAGDGNIVGTVIPEGVHNLTVLAASYNTTPQVSSRTISDFEFLTGITNPSEINIEMFPVPASSELRVRNLMNVRTIEILDITGKVVSRTNEIRDEEIRIPVHQLKSGIYFIRFNTDKGPVVKRLIK